MANRKTMMYRVERVTKSLVVGVVRLDDGTIADFVLPRAICPQEACIAGGAFYLTTETVDPVKDDAFLKQVFDDVTNIVLGETNPQ